jgi:riboflavin synthase
MFTGIIKELGRVRGFDRIGPVYRLSVEAAGVSADAVIGASISVNGACLTVVEKKKGLVFFDVMEETVKRTAFSGLKTGDKVNLEPSLKAGEEMGGHFVLGHVDCRGTIARLKKNAGESSIEITFPEGYGKLVVGKGSIAIDGISLR